MNDNRERILLFNLFTCSMKVCQRGNEVSMLLAGYITDLELLTVLSVEITLFEQHLQDPSTHL